MDWPKENLGISDIDFRNVFKYEPKATRVVRLEGPEKVRFISNVPIPLSCSHMNAGTYCQVARDRRRLGGVDG